MTALIHRGGEVLCYTGVVRNPGSAQGERNQWIWSDGKLTRAGIENDAANFGRGRERNIGCVGGIKGRDVAPSIRDGVRRPVSRSDPIAGRWTDVPDRAVGMA